MFPERRLPPSFAGQVNGIDVAGSVQYEIWKKSLPAPESALSSTYTSTDWNAGPGALLGHSAPGAVQSPTICALPPVPFGLGVVVRTIDMNVTGTPTCRPPATFACFV